MNWDSSLSKRIPLNAKYGLKQTKNEKGLLKDEIEILTSENVMLREKVELLDARKGEWVIFLSNYQSPY